MARSVSESRYGGAVGAWAAQWLSAGHHAIGPWAFWTVIAALGLAAAIVYPTQFTIGLIVGSIYALGAVGLTLIYGVVRVPHFAHGDAMMFSAYLTFFMLTGGLVGAGNRETALAFQIQRLPGATEPIWRFSFGYGLILAMIVAAVIAVPIFLLIDRIVYRRLQRRGAGIALIAVASLGVAIALRGLMLMIWGSATRQYTTGIRETVQIPGGPRIVADQLFILLAAVVLVTIVYVLLYRTKTGKAMRAAADNLDLARVAGIDTTLILRRTWIVAVMLITAAGSLLALQSQLKPELGFLLLLPIFAAAFLGGIGSPHGALIGGLIVGIVSEVTVSLPFINPGYKTSVAFVVLILVILVRPRGLFGVRL